MSRRLTYDRYLFGAAMLIIVVGLAMIYSASAMIAMQKSGIDNPYFYLGRQSLWLLVSAGVMLALMHVDLNRLRMPVLVHVLVAGVVALLIVALFQPAINGTHRWIVISRFHFQPSELAKPIIILFLASQLAQKEERIDDLPSTLLPIGSVLATICGLVLLGPDFGTALTILAVSLILLFVAGVSWKRIAVFSIALVPACIALLLSADYRRDRLLSFLNPEADPLGKGFQAMQSLIAIGTGGMTGLGIGNGRQKLFFLPEPHTDFIFSIIGEELGFTGAMILLLAFAFLLWRGFRLAWLARDRFAFYAALGFTLMIGLQMLINVSVALCLLPTKGIPLPLVSYGGSSLMASMIAIGLLLNISQQSD
ncbi:MAG TPA: putative lipid II flippase FtsW [Thermoanaerobaculia bacterium]|nr:putative lipid II flippase FtsW [Thermoanaerobaculia bacterium]